MKNGRGLVVRRTEKKDGVWAKGAKLGRKLMMDLDMRVMCVYEDHEDT